MPDNSLRLWWANMMNYGAISGVHFPMVVIMRARTIMWTLWRPHLRELKKMQKNFLYILSLNYICKTTITAYNNSAQ